MSPGKRHTPSSAARVRAIIDERWKAAVELIRAYDAARELSRFNGLLREQQRQRIAAAEMAYDSATTRLENNR